MPNNALSAAHRDLKSTHKACANLPVAWVGCFLPSARLNFPPMHLMTCLSLYTEDPLHKCLLIRKLYMRLSAHENTCLAKYILSTCMTTCQKLAVLHCTWCMICCLQLPKARCFALQVLYDLLSAAPGSVDSLQIVEEGGATVVKGLNQIQVTTEEEALALLFEGSVKASFPTCAFVQNAEMSFCSQDK